MINNLEEYFKETQPAQCINCTRWLMERMKRLNPKTYMEIGCAHLATFKLYESLLPPAPEGLAVGVDIRSYKQWSEYSSESGCDFVLIMGDSSRDDVVSEVKSSLGCREIDFLFIDGWHGIEAVEADWDSYSPLVRKGGIVAVHDVDPVSYSAGIREGQGGAHLMVRLISEGKHHVQMVPGSSIGTAFIKKSE